MTAAAPAAPAAIDCRSLVRIYRTESLEVQALQGLDLRVDGGEMLALVGASGSGKSTLLSILAGHDLPSAGSVRVGGRDLAALNARERLEYRRKTVGFVWQNPARNLLPDLSAAENVMLPQRFAGVGRRARRAHALELLDLMGIGNRHSHTPTTLSGGEQQRVAIAVALANSPRVLLADEPTGELDSASADVVLEALRSANDAFAVTVLIVTHDAGVSSAVQRTLAIRDGRTSTETLRFGDDSGSLGEGVEYAVVDRAGRLQLSQELVEAYGISGRVRLTHELGHIGVWPDRMASDTAPEMGHE